MKVILWLWRDELNENSQSERKTERKMKENYKLGSHSLCKFRIKKLKITTEDKRGPGRRRISWPQYLRKWFGETPTELFRLA